VRGWVVCVCVCVPVCVCVCVWVCVWAICRLTLCFSTLEHILGP
jgi:hypothetical protein